SRSSLSSVHAEVAMTENDKKKQYRSLFISIMFYLPANVVNNLLYLPRLWYKNAFNVRFLPIPDSSIFATYKDWTLTMNSKYR
ncbi:hypothetical protein, partial [Bacteroides fragilis]